MPCCSDTILIIADAYFLVIAFDQFSPSTLYNVFSGLLQSSGPLVGVFGSIFYFSAAISLVLLPFLSRLLTPIPLLHFCGVLLSVGSFLFAFETSPAMVYAARALTGLASGPVLPLVLTLISGHVKPRRFSLAQAWIFIFYAAGGFLCQILLSVLTDQNLGWQNAFLAVAALTVVVLISTLIGFACSNHSTSEPGNRAALSAGFLDVEKTTLPRTITRMEYASLIAQMSLPTAVLFNFEGSWAGLYLTERFAYIPRESGVMQGVLTIGFALGLFSLAPFGNQRAGQLGIGILNVVAIVTAVGIASVPVGTNGAVVLVLFFAFALSIGGILPIAGNLLDEVHTTNGRHIITGLLVMNIVTGLLELSAGGLLSLFDGEEIEMQFGLPVMLPSALILFFSFGSVFILPKPGNAVESPLV
jgi:MFS family permease